MCSFKSNADCFVAFGMSSQETCLLGFSFPAHLRGGFSVLGRASTTEEHKARMIHEQRQCEDAHRGVVTIYCIDKRQAKGHSLGTRTKKSCNFLFVCKSHHRQRIKPPYSDIYTELHCPCHAQYDENVSGRQVDLGFEGI